MTYIDNEVISEQADVYKNSRPSYYIFTIQSIGYHDDPGVAGSGSTIHRQTRRYLIIKL